jgi:hypothetical protein
MAVSDSLIIEWPGAIWFGKQKIKVGTFASCELKHGITSSSNKVEVDGQKVLMMKEPFKIELKDSLSRQVSVKGKWLKSTGYWSEDSNFLSNLLNIDIQSETYSPDPTDLAILSAEIQFSEKPGEVWELKMKRIQSTGVILQELDAFLSDGARIILIEGPIEFGSIEDQGAGRETSYYSFVEDGIVLARVNLSVKHIAFAKQTPTITRSLLLAAAISLAN